MSDTQNIKTENTETKESEDSSQKQKQATSDQISSASQGQNLVMNTVMSIPPPRAMNIKQNQVENWKTFREQWENFEIAADLVKKTDEQRVAILKACIGDECFRILTQLKISEDNKKNVKGILDALEGYFKPKVNTRYERFLFNTAKQEENENVEAFVCRLRDLIKTCSYPANEEDNFVCDRLIPGMINNEMRKKLLMTEDLTLQKAIETCKLIEQTTVRMKNLSCAENKAEAHETYESNEITHRRNHHMRRASLTRPCTYCGYKHQKGKCPAYGRKCRKCNGKNHFSTVCTTHINSNSSEKNKNRRTTDRSRNVKVNAIVDTDDTESVTDDEILLVQSMEVSERKGIIRKDVEFVMNHGKKARTKFVNCVIDTGASCNIMNVDLYMELSEDKIRKSAAQLKSFSGHVLKPIGEGNVRCVVNRTRHDLRFQLLNTKCDVIIGAKDSILMNIIQINRLECVNPRAAEEILSEYKDVFEGDGNISVPLKLEVDESVQPKQQQPRRMPVTLRKELKLKLDELEKRGIISKVDYHTPWISNLVLVRRNNKIRVCLDPTEVNKALKRANYQIPTIDEMLPNLTKAKVFSTVDAKNGFWQVPLDKASRDLTVFWTPFGRYCWNRMPFGISPAPEYWQKIQHEILSGLIGVEVIADDILIFGRGDTREEATLDHNRNLENLLKRLRKHNLKLNAAKTRLMRTQVPFFGHMLTHEGLKMDSSKVDAIVNMTAPRNRAETQTFIGLCTYLSRFLPNLSSIAAPLREICKTSQVWCWKAEQKETFRTLKNMIATAPILRYYDLNKEVTLQCDASQNGLGAVLMQDSHPVAFASRTLSMTEQQYAQIEKECLAIVFACKRFDQYLCGRRNIRVESDHLPLQSIFKKPLLDAPRRLQRMRLSLQRYDIEVTYKKGKHMYIADTLSRAALEADNEESEGNEEVFRIKELQQLFAEIAEINIIEDMKNIQITEQRIENIKEETRKDPKLPKLIRIVREGWPTDATKIDPELKCFWTYKDDITIQDGLLLKGDRIIIPTSLRPTILNRLHYNHQGMEACMKKARDAVFWPNMNSQIRNLCSTCEACLRNRPNQQSLKLQCPVLPDLPFQRVGLDIFEVPKGNEKKFYLITVDYFSDFFEVDELPAPTAFTVIGCCKKNFSRHGIPQIVTTDGGTPFVNEQFQQFSKQWEFKHTRSSPHHQQGNGKAESAVKVAKSLLKKASYTGNCFWKMLLDQRNTVNHIGSSPVQRLMSRRTRCSVPMISKKLQPEMQHNVKNNIIQTRRVTKKYYDKKSVTLPKLEQGQDVMVQLRKKPEDKTWTQGVVINPITDRSAIVRVGATDYLRNRQHVQIVPSPTDSQANENLRTPMNEQQQRDPGEQTSSESIPDEPASSEPEQLPMAYRKPKRNTRKPDRYTPS